MRSCRARIFAWRLLPQAGALDVRLQRRLSGEHDHGLSAVRSAHRSCRAGAPGLPDSAPWEPRNHERQGQPGLRSGHAAVASPMCGNDYLLRADAGCARLRLSLSKVALIGQLGALLGELPSAPLEFAPDMDLASAHGRSFARYVLAAAEDLDQPVSILSSPIAIASFEQFIMTGLLLSHEHNYTQAFRRLDKYIPPRDVRRAIDYMECHSDAPLTIGDLVNATGVAGRTLFKHFKDFKGVSPMRYMRNVRFDRVRQSLLSAEPEANVTEIALSWGFVHMGRFSVEYRERFGESPSQTLKRRRSPLRPLEKR